MKTGRFVLNVVEPNLKLIVVVVKKQQVSLAQDVGKGDQPNS